MKRYLYLLVFGEILLISMGILNKITTKELTLMIIGYVGVWLTYSLVSISFDKLRHL